MAITERAYALDRGVALYRLKQHRKLYMVEGIDWVYEGTEKKKQVVYTDEGEGKVDTWLKGVAIDEAVIKAEENTGVIQRVVNVRKVKLALWNGHTVGCMVPLGFRMSVGDRVPVRKLAGDAWALDMKRAQSDDNFVKVLKMLKRRAS